MKEEINFLLLILLYFFIPILGAKISTHTPHPHSQRERTRAEYQQGNLSRVKNRNIKSALRHLGAYLRNFPLQDETYRPCRCAPRTSMDHFLCHWPTLLPHIWWRHIRSSLAWRWRKSRCRLRTSASPLVPKYFASYLSCHLSPLHKCWRLRLVTARSYIKCCMRGKKTWWWQLLFSLSFLFLVTMRTHAHSRTDDIRDV